MKVLYIFVFFSILLCACKHDDYVPDCVCENLDSTTFTYAYGTQEGMIIFPKPLSQLGYRVWAKKDFTGAAHGKQYHGICTDSAFIKQIQDKHIQDSSEVIMTGVGAFLLEDCNVFYQRTAFPSSPSIEFSAPTLRIKTIDKK
jgi:hypothetical protein